MSEEAGRIGAAGTGIRNTLIAVRSALCSSPWQLRIEQVPGSGQHISVIPPAQQSMPPSDEAAASGACIAANIEPSRKAAASFIGGDKHKPGRAQIPRAALSTS